MAEFIERLETFIPAENPQSVVTDLRSGPGKTVEVQVYDEKEYETATAEIKKLEAALKMKVSQRKQRKLRLIVKNVPKSYTVEQFQAELCAENDCQADFVRVVIKLQSEQPTIRTFAFVREVSRQNCNKLIKRGKISLDWNACPVEAYFRVIQCVQICSPSKRLQG